MLELKVIDYNVTVEARFVFVQGKLIIASSATVTKNANVKILLMGFF